MAQISGITTLNHAPFGCQTQKGHKLHLSIITAALPSLHLDHTWRYFIKRTVITGIGKSQNDYNTFTTFSQKWSFWNTVGQDQEFWTNMGKWHSEIWYVQHYYTLSIGTGRNEQDLQGKKKNVQGMVDVSLYQFILHVTLLLTQENKHFVFLLPSVHTVVWFRNEQYLQGKKTYREWWMFHCTSLYCMSLYC